MQQVKIYQSNDVSSYISHGLDSILESNDPILEKNKWKERISAAKGVAEGTVTREAVARQLDMIAKEMIEEARMERITYGRLMPYAITLHIYAEMARKNPDLKIMLETANKNMQKLEEVVKNNTEKEKVIKLVYGELGLKIYTNEENSLVKEALSENAVRLISYVLAINNKSIDEFIKNSNLDENRLKNIVGEFFQLKVEEGKRISIFNLVNAHENRALTPTDIAVESLILGVTTNSYLALAPLKTYIKGGWISTPNKFIEMGEWFITINTISFIFQNLPKGFGKMGEYGGNVSYNILRARGVKETETTSFNLPEDRGLGFSGEKTSGGEETYRVIGFMPKFGVDITSGKYLERLAIFSNITQLMASGSYDRESKAAIDMLWKTLNGEALLTYLKSLDEGTRKEVLNLFLLRKDIIGNVDIDKMNEKDKELFYAYILGSSISGYVGYLLENERGKQQKETERITGAVTFEEWFSNIEIESERFMSFLQKLKEGKIKFSLGKESLYFTLKKDDKGTSFGAGSKLDAKVVKAVEVKYNPKTGDIPLSILLDLGKGYKVGVDELFISGKNAGKSGKVGMILGGVGMLTTNFDKSDLKAAIYLLKRRGISSNINVIYNWRTGGLAVGPEVWTNIGSSKLYGGASFKLSGASVENFYRVGLITPLIGGYYEHGEFNKNNKLAKRDEFGIYLRNKEGTRELALARGRERNKPYIVGKTRWSNLVVEVKNSGNELTIKSGLLLGRFSLYAEYGNGLNGWMYGVSLTHVGKTRIHLPFIGHYINLRNFALSYSNGSDGWKISGGLKF